MNTHMQPADIQFGNVELRKCYWLGRIVFWAEGASALESAVCVGWAEVHVHCASSVSADSVQCHFGKEGIQLCGFDEA